MILNVKKNIELTIEERKEIDKLCKKINRKIPEEVLIIKNKGLSKKSGSGMALFSMLHRHTIYICADSDVTEELISKIGHELIHRADFFKYTWKYAFMVQPLVRERYLEPQAYAEEKSIMLSFLTKRQAKIIKNGRAIKKKILSKRSRGYGN